MSSIRAAEHEPGARFRTLSEPMFLGRGEWGTERYEFGSLEVWARSLPSAPQGSLYLYWVGALRPGRGDGTAGLRWLTEVADEAGVTLVLHADPWGTRERMPRDVLRTWYERYGFAARSNRLVPYWPGRLGLTMCREPR
jgi:hypothetical protein